MSNDVVAFEWRGSTSYQDSLNEQQVVHKAVVNKDTISTILFQEHYPVLTLGNRSDRSNILVSEDDLKKQGVCIASTDRGGEVTAHVPGQLVVYPILDLVRFSLTPKKLVCMLEGCVIELLEQYGIEAYREPDYPGVWVREKKICSIGIRIKQRVSFHGLALNVCNSLSLFDKIVPCGIRNKNMTVMTEETSIPVNVADTAARLQSLLYAALMRNGELNRRAENG